MARTTRMRVNPGLRLDAAWVDKDTLVTKQWTEVSSTLAKSLVGSTHQGRNKFEFEDTVADEAPVETEPADAADESE